MTLQARTLQGHPFTRGNNNVVSHDHVVFHKLVFDLSKDLHNTGVVADATREDANQHRLSPGGPDPHHNAGPHNK
ncbi:hypothetical protein TSUD_103940 [Trifolium subterraneum]|uniref:Uncharacterized protein n=1 Tax=Trifolium subterraneum TaxID=3900 RepID=A0A2Z6MTP9_TRISU|nr:hypothetical protein TSUD_103940 [Trifolium subterraneum]